MEPKGVEASRPHNPFKVIAMPAYTAHNLKRMPKGSERAPKRSSEKAWVRRVWPSSLDNEPPAHTYLEFVRYYRWYCHRSPLLQKVLDSAWSPRTQQMEPQYHVKHQRWIS